jgi:lysophospholipase L1-like esterase
MLHTSLCGSAFAHACSSMIGMPLAFLRRWVLAALVIAQIAIVLFVIKNWFYVTTYRLYLDRRVGDVRYSTAVQRFDVEGRRIVPQIATRDRERVAFAIAVNRPSMLHVSVRAEDRARYELHVHHNGRDELLARGDATSSASSVVAPLPTDPGVVELVSDGALTWIDPRVVRDLHAAPHATALAILLIVSLGLTRRRRTDVVVPARVAPPVWFKMCAPCVSLTLALLILEGGLRLLGDRVPPGIAAERHDLGEVRRDPRWEESARYERRLRPNVNAVNEWRYGDIVRMGYIPAAVSDGIVHRFRFRTDAEGFRNPAVRDRIEIAALGDSFTDAMTMAVDESWPSKLERRLGVPVQNYGTAGFGPQQERLVLSDFVAQHRPRFVVLAFFAGNDIFDAEAFDDFERSGGGVRRAVAGWRIKDVVSRADTWFLVSALHAGAAWVRRQETMSVAAETLEHRMSLPNGRTMTASFDRGMFKIPAGDSALRCAFMPPYLNTLTFSQDHLAARRGWALTRRAIAGMQRDTQAFGGTFAVMFLPFKSQVYFPLLRRAFGRDELQAAFQFYLGANPKAPDVEAMFRNRLAQNTLMRRFCEESGIPFLDVTETLQAHVESGENVYFPDESHLNEAGQTIVADALAAFLRRR